MSNLQFKGKFLDDRADAFHSYFDIQVIHQSNDNQDVQLKFNETRNAPFIMCPEKYFISVVRFDISTNLPVFVPKLQLNQPDPNLTDYTMWINSVTSGVTVPIQFEWLTQGVSPAPLPQSGTNYTSQSLENDYYYCYSYNYFLGLMNKQIATAIAGHIPTLKVWFTMDSATLNLQLNFTSSNLSDVPQFYFNTNLKNLISSFPYTIATVPSVSPATLAYQVMWGNGYQSVSATVPIVVNTETSPFPAWNPVASVVFTTTTLPVVASNETLPVVYGTATQVGSVSSNNNIAAVLTDFVVSVGPNSLYNPVISYLPTAEYRLNDMYGNSPLSNLDLAVWWKDKYNNYYPLLIPSGGSASIKLMFRKKNYNTSSKNIIV